MKELFVFWKIILNSYYGMKLTEAERMMDIHRNGLQELTLQKD